MTALLANLSDRDRRALTLLAIAASAILLVRFVVFPALEAAGDPASSVAVREKTLRKYRALAAAAPARENDYGALKIALGEAEKGLLQSRTTPLAVAEVQQQVRELAAAAQVQLHAVEFLPLKKTGAYTLAPVSVRFSARPDQLVALLMALETAPKILTLEQLRVNAANQQTPEGLKKMVTVYMQISGVAATEQLEAAPGGKP
jgi:Tfp pilus assembly protein PilO